MTEDYKTLNEILADGSFTYKTYRGDADFIKAYTDSGMTDTEQELVTEWFGDRLICTSDVKKFTKFFNRQWNLHAWQFRNSLAAWIGETATSPGILKIASVWAQPKADTNQWNWNTDFLLTVEMQLAGTNSTEQTGSGTSSSTTTTKGGSTTDSTTESTQTHTGTDKHTSSGTNDTTASGTNDTTTSGTTHATGQSTTKTGNVNTASSTDTDTGLTKNSPMSIANAGATAGSIPALDWTYASGATQAQKVTTGTTTDEGTNTTASEDDTTNSGTNKITTASTTNTETSGTDTTTYDTTTTGSTTGRTEGTNTSEGTTTGTTGNTAKTDGTSTQTNTGRTANLSQLYGEFLSLLNSSQPWEWMRKQLEPCFLSVYDI